MELHTLILSTGSNLGNRIDNLHLAANKIGQLLGPVLQSSSVYESKAWGYNSEHSFYNQCLEVSTSIEPMECMKRILEIEAGMGRKRGVPMYTDRIIDIDIVFFDDLILNTNGLRIPHEKLTERRFVLLPLAEILPGLLHPVFLKTVRDLLTDCPDKGLVTPIE